MVKLYVKVLLQKDKSISKGKSENARINIKERVVNVDESKTLQINDNDDDESNSV